MASFQVEIASSSTFGYVMRNHSRRDRCSSGGSNSFPENLKDLVHSCISCEPRNSDVDANENVNQMVDLTDLWVHKPQYLANSDRNAEKSPKKSSGKASDNWDKARKKAFSIGRKDEDNEGLAGELSEAPRVVSSLVQRWRDFEAEAKTPQSANNNNSSTCTTRTNSGVTLLPESVEIPQTGFGACDDSSDGIETPTNDDSSFVDWESDRRVVSAPPSVRGRDSDATESERVRVIDIIKKLTSSGGDENHDLEPNNNNAAVSEAPPLPRVKTSAEQGCFCPLLHSPRIIRGRQAFTDLLVHMERERERELEGLTERKAVSKFQQKGRIQAMLKLKFLRREAEVKDAPPSSCISPESIRLTQSSIMHLREKFKTRGQQGLADSKATSKEVSDSNNSEPRIVSTSKPKKESHHPEATDSICHNKEAVENTSITGNISKSKQLQEENHPRELVEKRSPCTEVDINVQATDPSSQCKDVAGSSFKSNPPKVCFNCQQTKSSAVHVNPKESSKNSNEEKTCQRVSSEVRRNNELTESAQTGGAKEQWNSNVWTSDWEENDWGWVSDYSHHTHHGWDQLQFDFRQRVDEVSQDWINDVSRPRSEWEDLRQARYLEMLDPFFNNDDLQQLLQRKSVSSFLSGGMKDKIDQLMISRSQKQSAPMNDGVQQIQEQVTDKKGEKVEEVVQGAGGGKAYQEEEEDGDGNGYSQTWSHNQECDIRDDYDQIASTSLPQFQSSNFFSQVNEMKLIDELMGHMEQLHEEMSEIRRAIISCIDMQMKLQHSIKNEVALAFNQLGKKSGRLSSSERSCKRNCSICHEMLVDSLLYRCGHMCTCFKCAQELQGSDGKCPICQAPIEDVVRACVDA